MLLNPSTQISQFRQQPIQLEKIEDFETATLTGIKRKSTEQLAPEVLSGRESSTSSSVFSAAAVKSLTKIKQEYEQLKSLQGTTAHIAEHMEADVMPVIDNLLDLHTQLGLSASVEDVADVKVQVTNTSNFFTSDKSREPSLVISAVDPFLFVGSVVELSVSLRGSDGRPMADMDVPFKVGIRRRDDTTAPFLKDSVKILNPDALHVCAKSGQSRVVCVRLLECSGQRDMVLSIIPTNSKQTTIAPASTNSFQVVHLRFEKEHEIPTLWFKEEGGKSNQIILNVCAVNSRGEHVVPGAGVRLKCRLLYEDDSEVSNQDLLKFSDGTKLFLGDTGRCVIKSRIEALAKNHGQKKFKIEVTPDIDGLPSRSAVRPLLTPAILVKSKISRRNREARAEKQLAKQQKEMEKQLQERKQQLQLQGDSMLKYQLGSIDAGAGSGVVPTRAPPAASMSYVRSGLDNTQVPLTFTYGGQLQPVSRENSVLPQPPAKMAAVSTTHEHPLISASHVKTSVPVPSVPDKTLPPASKLDEEQAAIDALQALSQIPPGFGRSIHT